MALGVAGSNPVIHPKICGSKFPDTRYSIHERIKAEFMALKIGKLLVEHKLCTEEQINRALQAQRMYGGKLGTNLVELGFISDIDLATFLAKQLGIPAASPADFENIPKNVIDLVLATFAEKNKMVPIKLDQRIHVAISDPGNFAAVDELGFKTGKGIQKVVAPEIWVVAALERYYKIPREMRYISVKDSIAVEDVLVSTRHDTKKPEGSDSFHDYCARLLTVTKVEDVFISLSDFLAGFFPRLAIYTIRKNEIGGLLVRGFPIHTKQFTEIHAPSDSPTILRQIIDRNESYAGRLGVSSDDQKLFGPLGIEASKSVGIYPLSFQGKVVALIVGVPDKDLGPPRPEAGRVIMESLSKAAISLDIIALRRKLMQEPTVRA